jgi:hypothetical protein
MIAIARSGIDMGNDIVKIEDNQSVAGDMIAVIANLAKDKDTDVLKLERLLDVQIKMMGIQAELDFNRDFILMRQELPVIAKKGEIKNKEGRVTSRYSRYEDLHESINPILSKYGFAFSHDTKPYNDKMIITSKLFHKGGHSRNFEFVTPFDTGNALKTPMQASRSTASFGKRTNIINALDITEATEDSEIYNNQTVSIEQAEEIDTLISVTQSDREKVLAFCGVSSSLEISLRNYSKVKTMLQSKAGKTL